MEKVRDSGILAIYCALLFHLSAQPGWTIPEYFEYHDKVIHLGAYAILGLFAWRSFRHFVQKRSLLVFCCAGFSGLYGLSDEIHQFYVPGRFADPFDLIADFIGAMTSVLLILILKPAATVP